MKLLIDDAKAAFLEMAALCGCYAEGKSVYRDKCPLHCDATIDGFLTDRRTMLARIAELEKERDRQRDWIAGQDLRSDFQNARQMREEIERLRAQLDAMRAAASDVCKMVIAEKAGEEIARGTDR